VDPQGLLRHQTGLVPHQPPLRDGRRRGGLHLDAVAFVAEQGHRFLPLYDFDLHSGAWTHKKDSVCLEGFSLEAALECKGYQSRALSPGARRHLYQAFLAEARQLADGLGEGGRRRTNCSSTASWKN
jgi:hypothetical protein